MGPCGASAGRSPTAIAPVQHDQGYNGGDLEDWGDEDDGRADTGTDMETQFKWEMGYRSMCREEEDTAIAATERDAAEVAGNSQA